ncbi:MAG: YfiR family protein [Deltaproteobacteria bacterium]|nr:YfiR family protein [Deltaproteobacteria bacterium]MCW8893466.1 YfiR family protein [Deltaproteobacteria bacterium]MCW9050559.1 YfiR family protein [Deltaproteobacteria bacterium]
MLRRFCHIVLLVSLLSWSPQLKAAQEPREYQVKAAYLYNFAKFITWPETAFSDKKAPLVIGVLGKNEFNGYLEPLTSKTVRNRPIVVKHFKSIEDVSACQILYLSSSENKQLKTHLKKLSVQAIVTLSDERNFAKQGGIIQFTPVRGRLRFIINLEKAKAVGMKIDSQLLSLAIELLETKK